MPVKIPPDANVIRDRRLTLIRILKDFTAEDGRLDQLIDQVKKAMREKKVTFATSAVVNAELRSGGGGAPKKFVDPVLLNELRKKGRITEKEFLSVLCVRSSLMPQILSLKEIDAISNAAESPNTGTSSGSLYTDWKPGPKFDLDKIERAMLAAIADVD